MQISDAENRNSNSTNALTSMTSILLDGLTPNTVYGVSVQAITNSGNNEGMLSKEIMQRTGFGGQLLLWY